MAGLPGIQVRDEFFADRGLGLRRFVARAHRFHEPLGPFLHGAQIGQHQLGGDHLDVAHRIDRPGHVVHVVILETAHDLDDRVHLADVGEELITQPFPLARPLHQPGDIHKLNRGRHHLARVRKLAQPCQARVGHGHDALVGSIVQNG